MANPPPWNVSCVATVAVVTGRRPMNSGGPEINPYPAFVFRRDGVHIPVTPIVIGTLKHTVAARPVNRTSAYRPACWCGGTCRSVR